MKREFLNAFNKNPKLYSLDKEEFDILDAAINLLSDPKKINYDIDALLNMDEKERNTKKEQIKTLLAAIGHPYIEVFTACYWAFYNERGKVKRVFTITPLYASFQIKDDEKIYPIVFNFPGVYYDTSNWANGVNTGNQGRYCELPEGISLYDAEAVINAINGNDSNAPRVKKGYKYLPWYYFQWAVDYLALFKEDFVNDRSTDTNSVEYKTIKVFTPLEILTGQNAVVTNRELGKLEADNQLSTDKNSGDEILTMPIKRFGMAKDEELYLKINLSKYDTHSHNRKGLMLNEAPGITDNFLSFMSEVSEKISEIYFEKSEEKENYTISIDLRNVCAHYDIRRIDEARKFIQDCIKRAEAVRIYGKLKFKINGKNQFVKIKDVSILAPGVVFTDKNNVEIAVNPLYVKYIHIYGVERANSSLVDSLRKSGKKEAAYLLTYIYSYLGSKAAKRSNNGLWGSTLFEAMHRYIQSKEDLKSIGNRNYKGEAKKLIKYLNDVKEQANINYQVYVKHNDKKRELTNSEYKKCFENFDYDFIASLWFEFIINQNELTALLSSLDDRNDSNKEKAIKAASKNKRMTKKTDNTED